MLTEHQTPPGQTTTDFLVPQSTPMDDESAVALAETFRMLGDTTRVRILDVLSRSERCVSDIARAVGMSESAVSHQLRLLRGQRLVRPRRSGRQVFYVLDDHHIVGLFAQGLEHVQESARSSRLRRHEPPVEQS
jgi:ArsR family transcriptional regulator, lead/cadmium/zinc/bismuth-responsive transcriptional repressor